MRSKGGWYAGLRRYRIFKCSFGLETGEEKFVFARHRIAWFADSEWYVECYRRRRGLDTHDLPGSKRIWANE